MELPKPGMIPRQYTVMGFTDDDYPIPSLNISMSNSNQSTFQMKVIREYYDYLVTKIKNEGRLYDTLLDEHYRILKNYFEENLVLN